jgi:hypothetical protein
MSTVYSLAPATQVINIVTQRQASKMAALSCPKPPQVTFLSMSRQVHVDN